MFLASHVIPAHAGIQISIHVKVNEMFFYVFT